MNISVTITDDLYNEITAIASRLGISISECAEDALSTFADTVMKCLGRTTTVPADEPTITVEDVLRYADSCPVSDPIWIPDLRQIFHSAKNHAFDAAVMAAIKTGKIFGNRHYHPGGASKAELDEFVPDGAGGYYCVIARRR